jgi:hypothetical protein
MPQSCHSVDTIVPRLKGTPPGTCGFLPVGFCSAEIASIKKVGTPSGKFLAQREILHSLPQDGRIFHTRARDWHEALCTPHGNLERDIVGLNREAAGTDTADADREFGDEKPIHAFY